MDRGAPTRWIDRPGLDSWLAQALLSAALVEREELASLLDDARRGRHRGGPTLAHLLVDRQLLAAGEVERVA